MRKSDYKTIAVALAKVAFERKTYLRDAVDAVFVELHPSEQQQVALWQQRSEMTQVYDDTLDKLYSDAEQALKTPLQVAYEEHERDALDRSLN